MIAIRSRAMVAVPSTINRSASATVVGLTSGRASKQRGHQGRGGETADEHDDIARWRRTRHWKDISYGDSGGGPSTIFLVVA